MHKIFLILLLLGFMEFNCFKNSSQVVSTLDKNVSDIVPLNQDFNIKIGKTVEVENENLLINFESVPMDSRCPEGVRCFWSGEAQVILRFSRLDYPEKTDTLSLYQALSGTKKVGGYQAYSIEFKGLEPHPVFNQVLNPDDYEATLFVGKKITSFTEHSQYSK